jgi:cytochrome oxidase Cu insertion factor (SCO1/SenC/PrrC family)
VGPSVGSFSLVDQEGRPFGHENLKGHVWIGGQFNTRPAHKSAVIEALLKLQAEAKKEKKNTRLLGFSNDPGFDTPERIKAFGQATGFDFSRVTLLTGSTTDLSRLANGPLKPVDEFDPPPPSFDKKPPPKAKTKAKSAAGRQKMMQRPMRHKPLVIIDHTGHLRGHYATDRWGIDEAFHRSLHVAKAK